MSKLTNTTNYLLPLFRQYQSSNMMMYNEILAKKVLNFIIPTMKTDANLEINIQDYQKRQTLWQLLKSTMETIEMPLIRRFEKNPTGHDLNEATISLLSLKFRENKNLLAEIEVFLDKQEDIELDEKGNAHTDATSSSIGRPNIDERPTRPIQNSFRSKWERRRLHF